MSENYYKFEKIIDKFKQIYKEGIIEYEIGESILWINIDLGIKAICYPHFDNKKYKIIKSDLLINTVLKITYCPNDLSEFLFRGGVGGGIYYEDEEFMMDQDCFCLKIKNFEELKDVVDFILKVSTIERYNLSTNFQFKEIEVSKLLECKYIFIPELSKEYLLPLKMLQKKENLHGIAILLREYRTNSEIKPKHIEQLNEIKTIVNDFFKDEKNRVKIVDGSYFIANTVDIGISPKIYSHDFLTSSGLEYYDFKEDFRSREKYNIYFELTLQGNNSFIGMHDFLSTSNEGEFLLSELLERHELPQKIKFIQNKFEQIQYAIEDRLNRHEIEFKLRNLLLKKEVFILKNNLTVKRLTHIESYYNEQHKLIEIFQNPLPFIIEKAYRDFVKSDEELKILENGEKLLSILLKTRLLFVLEEYKTYHPTSYKKFKSNIDENFIQKKPTDGAFSYLNSILNKTIQRENIKLKCFDNFQENLNKKEINSLFGYLTELRNRSAHPPYDKRNFIDNLTSHLPNLIETYREAMNNIDFLIPMSFTNKNKKIIMSAKRLMGFESKFETIDIIISPDEILMFEIDELVAYNIATKKIIPFKTFVGLKIQDEPVYSIGLFDRYENGKPKFV